MEANAKDSVLTIAAIGLVAYASADVAHHAIGHGGACLGLGGAIISLSSIFVRCSLRGATIDLAGPAANLVLGLVAVLAVRLATHRSTATRLCWILVGAFNLLWFAMQLAFSAATRTDDWAWAMHVYHVSEPLRLVLIATGVLTYLATIRVIAAQMAPFANPRPRARTMVLTAWITAGVIACVTAAFDHNAPRAMLLHAAPQGFVLPLGLLFVPARAARRASPGGSAATLALSVPWVVAAAVVGIGSILLLGPGVAVAL